MGSFLFSATFPIFFRLKKKKICIIIQDSLFALHLTFIPEIGSIGVAFDYQDWWRAYLVTFFSIWIPACIGGILGFNLLQNGNVFDFKNEKIGDY